MVYNGRKKWNKVGASAFASVPLNPGYQFSRACLWFHFFPRLFLASCFPRFLSTNFLFPCSFMSLTAYFSQNCVVWWILLKTLRQILNTPPYKLLILSTYTFSWRSRGSLYEKQQYTMKWALTCCKRRLRKSVRWTKYLLEIDHQKLTETKQHYVVHWKSLRITYLFPWCSLSGKRGYD